MFKATPFSSPPPTRFFLSLTLELLQSPRSPVVSPSCLLSLIQALNFHSHSLTQEVKLNYSHYLAVSLRPYSLCTCLSFSAFCLLFGRTPCCSSLPLTFILYWEVVEWMVRSGLLVSTTTTQVANSSQTSHSLAPQGESVFSLHKRSEGQLFVSCCCYATKTFCLNLSIFQLSSFDSVSPLMD